MAMFTHGSLVRWLALCGALAIILAACSPGGAAAPASAGPVSLGQLKVGLGTAPPDPTAHFLYYAQQAGFYKSRGLDVVISPFSGDQTALRALASGDVDLEWTGCAAAMNAIEVGAPLRIISAFNPAIDYLLVVQKGIASPKGLVGKSLGVSQPGAVSFSVPKLMIQGDGGDFSKGSVVALGGSSARVQALIAKKIDAAVLNSSFAERTKAYDYLTVIADGVKALPDYLYACEVTTEKVLAARRPALQAWVTGTMEGVRWFYDHVAEATAISQKLLPDTAPAEIAAGVKAFAEKRYWNESGVLAEKAWAFTTKAAQDSGDLKGPLDYAKYVVTEFALTAQKEFGTK